MFPLDIVLDGGDTMDWQMAYLQSGPGDQPDRVDKWKRFQNAIINPFVQYHVPTIDLAKSTPKEAVCQVFEKVNTGGVTLTVFELLTATYAASDFELRKDWDARHERLAQHELLAKVDATAFLQIITLLAIKLDSGRCECFEVQTNSSARLLTPRFRSAFPAKRYASALGHDWCGVLPPARRIAWIEEWCPTGTCADSSGTRTARAWWTMDLSRPSRGARSDYQDRLAQSPHGRTVYRALHPPMHRRLRDFGSSRSLLRHAERVCLTFRPDRACGRDQAGLGTHGSLHTDSGPGLDRHPAQGPPRQPPAYPERWPIKVVRFSGASPAPLRGIRHTRANREVFFARLRRRCSSPNITSPITRLARTYSKVMDCFRFRRLVGKDVALEALREALRERKASADEIWRTAEVCRAKSLVGPVLEALSG